MSYWVEELKDYLTEEELEIYRELKEEEKRLRKEKLKKELLMRYRDRFSNELLKKYGVVSD